MLTTKCYIVKGYPGTTAQYAYMYHLIIYLSSPSPENKQLLLNKMEEYAPWTESLLMDFEYLKNQLFKLEKNHRDIWDSFADEAQRTWFFDYHPELKTMFFEAAQKRGLAEMKWVICY